MNSKNDTLAFPDTAQPLVLSYIRFSSARQASGDSLRRQTRAAQQWCLKRGWTLDEKLTYQDLGVSGFNQDNMSKGALSLLLEKVAQGAIPKGTYLLVENLDRLTRTNLPEAMNLLYEIVKAGIIFVTLQDNKEWTRETLANPFEFMGGAFTFFRGYDESNTKSLRARELHDEARKNRDRRVFGRAPGWLRRTSDGAAWEAIPEMVEVVNKVFELVACGYGGVAIAKQANLEKWPVPSLFSERTQGTWHVTFPAKLIRNRSVLGELEFHLSRGGPAQPTGEVVKDWYPQVVSEELFFRANSAIDSRLGKPMRRDASYRNIFQGLAFCGHCGATMARKMKSGPKNSKFYAQYVCSDRNRGVTKCPNMSAKEFENQFIPPLFQVFSSTLNSDQQLEPIKKKLAGVQGEIADIRKRRERLADAIEQATHPIPILAKRLSNCEQSLPSLERQESALKAQLSSAESYPDSAENSAVVLAALYAEDPLSERLRSEIHLKMMLAVECVWVWPQELALVQMKSSNQILSFPLFKTPRTRGNATFAVPGEMYGSPSKRYIAAFAGNWDFPAKRPPKIESNFVEHRMPSEHRMRGKKSRGELNVGHAPSI